MAIAGAVLFILFLYPRSEVEAQVLFGLSRSRFALGVIFLVLLLVNMGIAVISMMSRNRGADYAYIKISNLVSDKYGLIAAALYFMVFLTGALLLLIIPPVPVSLRFIEPVRARILSLVIWFCLAGLLSIILLKTITTKDSDAGKILSTLDRFMVVACVFLFTFFLYEHFAAWIGWVNKTRYSYWNLLAQEFLDGNLFLSDPPYTHDLTQYEGRWYVPNPPMPAILMMPLVYAVGAQSVVTSDFSMLFSAVNSVLIYLILDQLAGRQWIKISKGGIISLVVLIAFGTPHLWVGISGRMWFVSQILTVTLLGFATLLTLRSWSSWIVGILIGMAVATRPNGILSWFFVFAIAMQILKDEQGHVTFRQMLTWSIGSLIPVGFSIAGLLLYNQARFGDFLDFGYITIYGDPVIVQSAQTYGLFSTYYVPYNLRVMFLYLPEIHWGTRWPFLPSGAGMSLFLTTPPLIYLIRRYEFKWWILGGWLTVLLNFILLVHYHNTGKDQFGYRYILDAIVPITTMLGVALGKKIPWHFILLLLLSIVINLYGANWFMNG